MYLLLRCLLFNRYGNLSNRVILLSPLISRKLTSILLLFSITTALAFCLAKLTLSVEGFVIWACYSPSSFHFLTKPILFFCQCKGFHVIYLNDILVLVHSKCAGWRACSFLCSTLVHLGLCINSSKSDLCLTQHFCFLGLCQDIVEMCVSLPSDKLNEIQQLASSLFQAQSVTVCWVMSFWSTASFCAIVHS